jgi:hypothetical protein
MPSKVFISYRRAESAGHAGRVHDRLASEFGSDLLFMDVDAIPLGVNFVKVLREEVAKCDVLLALIGPNWLNVRDEQGNRRLDNPHDFMRIEIATALQRDVPVIPILLDGTRMPEADQLPKDLEELALRNGLDVRHASFHFDMDKLVRGLKRLSGQVGAPASPEDRRRGDGRIKVDARFVHGAPDGWFKPGAGTTPYRLATEAEWEYGARAGTTTPFWWGSSITPAQANYDGNHVYNGGGVKGEWRKSTVPVGSFTANLWGLYNVHGNVWEWCEDVWHDNYSGASADGSPWVKDGDVSRRVVRGGSWGNYPQILRAANRSRDSAVDRISNGGFRVARTLNP